MNIKQTTSYVTVLIIVAVYFSIFDCFYLEFVYEPESWYSHAWALLYFIPFFRSPWVGLFSAINTVLIIELAQGNQYCRDPQSFFNPWDAIPIIIYSIIVYVILKKVIK